MNKLMDLIEEGDASKILSEENLFERFNELLKYELVVIKDEKVFLTSKGILARKEGIENYLRRVKRHRVQNQFKNEQENNSLMKAILKKFEAKKVLFTSIIILLVSLLPYLKKIKFNLKDWTKYFKS